MSDELDRWLARGDLDELIREIDRRCDRAEWNGVEEVRFRSRAAVERGHQLWPASTYAEYRMALDAPAQWAASVVVEGAGWMAPGPLTEVVAQNHTFAELADHLEQTRQRHVVAAERVVRGEVIADDDLGGDLPGRLLDWEPPYELAQYGAEGAEFAAPALAPPKVVPDDGRGPSGGADETGEAEDGARALADLARHWSSQSEGRVRAVGVQGRHADALAALGIRGARWRPATLAEAGALLAWAAADGAAHGRRRGAGIGRSELWWVLAVLTALEDEWPIDPGPRATELEFGMWLPEHAVTGWSCRITVHDPLDDLAWALDASDAVASGSGTTQIDG